MSLILSGTDGLSDVDGTAATPAIRGTDANTGIFFPAADTIAFSEGGAEAMRIDSSGDLGLGVTPSVNTVSGSGYRQIEVGTTAGNMIFAGGNEMLVLQNVIYNSGFKYVVSTFASQYRQNAGKHEFYTAPTGTAGNAVTFTQAMTLDSSGNLGIGTSSAGATLSVVKAISAGNIGTSFQQELVNNNGANVGDWTGTIYRWLPNNANTNQAYIGAIVTIASGDTKSDLVFGVKNSSAGNTIVEAMRISSGSLQLKKASNETEATAQFYISGSGYEAYHWLDGTAYYIGQNSSVRSLRIYSNSYTAGVNLASGGTSWGTFSDERLKYDIEPITNGLDKLNSIRCVSYRLKDVDASDSQKKLGIIAQDLVGVVDEVIDITKRHGDETDYMSVRYTELIPVLIKSIQEQQALITQLTARITALEGA